MKGRKPRGGGKKQRKSEAQLQISKELNDFCHFVTILVYLASIDIDPQSLEGNVQTFPYVLNLIIVVLKSIVDI